MATRKLRVPTTTSQVYKYKIVDLFDVNNNPLRKVIYKFKKSGSWYFTHRGRVISVYKKPRREHYYLKDSNVKFK